MVACNCAVGAMFDAMEHLSGIRTATAKLTLTKHTVEILKPAENSWIAWDDKLTGFVTSKFADLRTSGHWHHNLLIITRNFI